MARREAALAQVRKYGDPVLRERARPVPAVDAAVAAADRAGWRRLLEDAGLGAEAQLGDPQSRLRLPGRSRGPDGPIQPVRALVNPEVEWATRRWSSARRAASRSRASGSRSSARRGSGWRRSTRTGGPVVIDAEMPEARVLQHELDHLDGVLTLDRASRASGAPRCASCGA